MQHAQVRQPAVLSVDAGNVSSLGVLLVRGRPRVWCLCELTLTQRGGAESCCHSCYTSQLWGGWREDRKLRNRGWTRCRDSGNKRKCERRRADWRIGACGTRVWGLFGAPLCDTSLWQWWCWRRSVDAADIVVDKLLFFFFFFPFPPHAPPCVSVAGAGSLQFCRRLRAKNRRSLRGRVDFSQCWGESHLFAFVGGIRPGFSLWWVISWGAAFWLGLGGHGAGIYEHSERAEAGPADVHYIAHSPRPAQH